MPLNPTNPTGGPRKDVFDGTVPAATILQTQTATVIVAPKTGYLTKATFTGLAAITGAASPSSRSFSILDPTTRVVTDGIVAVAGTSASKGVWASGTYSTGDLVVYNNQVYVAIASVTTEAPTDTTKWQGIDSLGLNFLTSRTGAFDANDIGKTLSGTGFSSATIVAVPNARTVQLSVANSTVRNALSTTIGVSRTLAETDLVSGVNVTANVPLVLTLSTSDTKVYKGDAIQVVSAPIGGTGLADTGGGTVTLEITSYGEGV